MQYVDAENRFIDLSHVIENGLITYKGMPAPIICDYLSFEQSRSHYGEGTEFSIKKIEMVANTGTYLDSPAHRYRDGRDLSEMLLSSLANLDAVVIRANYGHAKAIGAKSFDGIDVQGKAVLVHSGWDANWATDEYFERSPFLTKDAAEFLAGSGAALVGIDSLNIDDTTDLSRPVHTILLGADIPIVEHLCNLQSVPDSGFKFFAVPPRIKQFGTFPVRAFALIK
jgi:arylformamidase